MYAVIDAVDDTSRSGLEVTVRHAILGRLRLHVSQWPTGDPEYIEEIVARMRGVRSVRANRLTGNLLVYYNSAATNHQTLLNAVRTALLLAPSSIRILAGAGTDLRMADEAPDSIHLAMPMLHLVYSCSPLGVAMHLGEIGWAINCRRPRGTVVPILHLICSFSPLGLVLHLGELVWALAPFASVRRTIGQSPGVLSAKGAAA